MPKQWNHASASQLRSALACRRRWWFAQISDLDAPPPTEAQTRGRSIHAAVEAALETGQAPAGDPVAAGLYAALCNLVGKDRTDATLRSEQRIALRCGDVEVIGYIDLLAVSDRMVQVYDYKTTSDWQYAQSPEQLANDVQMRVYAHAAALLYGVDEVEVIHVVVHKKTREIRETRITLDAASLRQWWYGPVETLLDELRGHALARTSDEVAADESACGQYGGCPYLDHCAAGRRKQKENPYKQIEGKDMSSLRDLIRQRHAAGQNSPATASTPAAPVTPAPAPVAAPAAPATAQQSLVAAPAPTPTAEPRGDYERAAWQLSPHLRQVGTRLSAVELKKIVGLALGLQRVAWRHVEMTVAALPALGIQAELSPAGLVVSGAVGAAAAPAAPADDAINPSGWPEPVVEPVVEPEPVVEAPAPADRVELATDRVELAPDRVEAEAPPLDDAPVLDEVDDEDEDVEPLTLYIDCVPSCAHVTLAAVLDPFVSHVTERAGVHAYLLDYRQGQRQVAAMVAGARVRGAVVVDSSCDVWREVSSVLLPMASLVVRGVR